MSLIATVLATVTEEKITLLMPPIAFAIVAFVVFLALGVVTWSYRDVANRNSRKNAARSHDSHDSHSAGH